MKLICFFLQECEGSFLECTLNDVNSGHLPFKHCIKDTTFSNLAGCDIDCAPTYNMLKTSEEPVVAKFDNFGPGLGTPSLRPDSSLCIANSNFA